MVVDPVVIQVLEAGVALTGAGRGWLVAASADGPPVVGGVSADADAALVGATIGDDVGATAFVIATGQPLSLSRASQDERFHDHPLAVGSDPITSVLTVPCLFRGEVVGALELVDDVEGAFSLDDLDVVAEIAAVAGAALATAGDRRTEVPPPGELAASLRHLAVADPARYAQVATLVEAVLAHA
jgi:GAF domain-containing protein